MYLPLELFYLVVFRRYTCEIDGIQNLQTCDTVLQCFELMKRGSALYITSFYALLYSLELFLFFTLLQLSVFLYSILHIENFVLVVLTACVLVCDTQGRAREEKTS